MRKIVNSLLVCMLIISICGCQARELTSVGSYAEEKPHNYTFTAFDTECAISIYGVADKDTSSIYANDMVALIKSYDELFSRSEEGSQIYEINNRKSDSVLVANEICEILGIAKDFNYWSKGKFDLSIGTLIDLWDVKNRKTLPTEEEIAEAKSHVNNYSYMIENSVSDEKGRNNKVTFYGDTKTQYDFGALIKGYCCDALKQMISENDYIKACIVNLGGNVLCVGQLDNKVDGAFNVGIFKPFSENEIIEQVKVVDKNVITSGNYQRYFKVDGDNRVYSHIIDPETGYPVNNGLDSVTIISENGLLGDYLSTACMLLGERESKELIDFCKNTFGDDDLQAIFVHSSGKVTKYPKNVKHY